MKYFLIRLLFLFFDMLLLKFYILVIYEVEIYLLFLFFERNMI